MLNIYFYLLCVKYSMSFISDVVVIVIRKLPMSNIKTYEKNAEFTITISVFNICSEEKN